jgi:hypothetical protein
MVPHCTQVNSSIVVRMWSSGLASYNAEVTLKIRVGATLPPDLACLFRNGRSSGAVLCSLCFQLNGVHGSATRGQRLRVIVADKAAAGCLA